MDKDSWKHQKVKEGSPPSLFQDRDEIIRLLARNRLDALLMAASCKLSVEELVKALTAYFLADEATGEDYDIGIVVLADEVGNLGLPNKSGTNLLVLVEGHGDAFARTTHSDAWIDFTLLDAFS